MRTLALLAAAAVAVPALACADARDCRNLGTVGGGVGGAVIGSNLAHGGGRTGGAILGGLVGAVAGHAIAENNCGHDRVACHWTTEYHHHVAYRIHLCRGPDGVWRRT